MVAASTGLRAGFGVGLRRRRRGAPGGRECSDMSSMEGIATRVQRRATTSATIPSMKIALTVNDFLRRAEAIYPHREAIVDEPAQPAESWGTITYSEMAARARAQAAALDSMGIGVGERVAVV